MNIREAAATSGLSADTIRFYEKKGVLPRPPRRDNGYRSYTDEHVATLRLARGLKDLGLGLRRRDYAVGGRKRVEKKLLPGFGRSCSVGVRL